MMATIMKFKDEDGIVKWGELAISYNPNKPPNKNNKVAIPVVITDEYPGRRTLRLLNIDEIIESK